MKYFIDILFFGYILLIVTCAVVVLAKINWG